MSDTTATQTITLPGTWVEYWNDREYSNPRADVEYRNLDAKIQAGIRRCGTGSVTTIELNHDELVILEEVADLMVIVAGQGEPGRERSREMKAAATGHLRILEALAELNRSLAHGQTDEDVATAPASVPSLATTRSYDEHGFVDHTAVRAAFEGFPILTSPEHAVELLIASNAVGVSGATADQLAADVAAWLDDHGYASSPWVKQKPGRILADIALTGMYRTLVTEAAERGAAYWRSVTRKNNGGRIRETHVQRRYDDYAEACKRARICRVMDCETFSPYHEQCAEHCVACADGAGHEHAGETLAHILDNAPVWRRSH